VQIKRISLLVAAAELVDDGFYDVDHAGKGRVDLRRLDPRVDREIGVREIEVVARWNFDVRRRVVEE